MSLPSPRAFLFELLSPCGFVPDQIDEILAACNGEVGSCIFWLPDHRVVKDRDTLIWVRQEVDESQSDVVATIASPCEGEVLLDG